MDPQQGQYLIGLSNAGIESFEGLKPSDAAVRSITNTLELSGIEIADVDFLISATTTPDYNNPGLSQSILGKFPNIHIGGLEIRQSAAGFHFAVDLAKNFISAGVYKSIIIVCTEFLARSYQARQYSVLPDPDLEAAQAISRDAVFSCLVCSEEFKTKLKMSATGFKLGQCAVYSSEKGVDSFSTQIPSSSQNPERITKDNLKANMHLPKLDTESFVSAVQSAVPESLGKFDFANCKYFVTHSPIPALHKKLNWNSACPSAESVDVIESLGYQGAAGIGSALIELQKKNVLAKSEKLSSLAVGAGLNWGMLNMEVF